MALCSLYSWKALHANKPRQSQGSFSTPTHGEGAGLCPGDLMPKSHAASCTPRTGLLVRKRSATAQGREDLARSRRAVNLSRWAGTWEDAGQPEALPLGAEAATAQLLSRTGRQPLLGPPQELRDTSSSVNAMTDNTAIYYFFTAVVKK